MNNLTLTGHILGQYELRELLGIGGMGAVYRAHQITLDRDVAIKVLSSQLTGEAGYIERFYREARTAAALEHKHIVPIYDYSMQDDLSYVVMRLLNGGTLNERLQQRRETQQPLPSLGETADMLKQVASALDYAHSQGVIHRDVKPSNVMFDHQGDAYLVDFGIAKILEATHSMTASGMAMGTPSYMSPEQWRAEDLTPAADQYALAAMIYALVTGRVPFEAANPFGLMHKHLNDMPTPPHSVRADIPREVSLVLERALAKRAQERFPSVVAFAQAFERAVGSHRGEPSGFFTFRLRNKSRPAGITPSGGNIRRATPVTMSSPLYRRPWVWGVLGAVLILLAVVAVLLLNRDDDSSPSDETGFAQTQVAFGATQTAFAVTPTADEAALLRLTLAAISEQMQAPSETPEPTVTLNPTLITHTPSVFATVMPEVLPTLEILANTLTFTPAWTSLPTITATSTDTSLVEGLPGVEVPTNTPTPILTSTPTPTGTNTPQPTVTFTFTPSHTSTFTPSPLPIATATYALLPPTEPNPLQAALERAAAFVGSNADWEPVIHSFDGVEMVLVPAGCFLMGSENGQRNESPVHRVCLSEPFWIDRYEVDNHQFSIFDGQAAENSVFFGANRPREQISWFEASDFCALRGARLPTEAEWEFAARGPDALEYPWGDLFSMDSVVYGNTSGGQTVNVGIRPTGASWVGALDMSGNVSEWVADWHGDYSAESLENPIGPMSGKYRVLRGGSFDNSPDLLRATYRFKNTPGFVSEFFGFRCARSVATSTTAAG